MAKPPPASNLFKRWKRLLVFRCKPSAAGTTRQERLSSACKPIGMVLLAS